MAAATDIVRLLVVDQTGELSKKILHILQDSGFRTKALVVSSDNELATALQKTGWSLMLVNQNTEQGMVSRCFKYKLLHCPELPLMIYSDSYHFPTLEPLLQQGAYGYLDLGRNGLLIQQLKQALHEARRAKQHKILELDYQELEKQFINLMESSRDAIAYIHDATLIQTNSSFASRFGYDDRRVLEGTPILDLIAEQDQDKLKEILSHFNGETPTPESIATHIKGTRNIPIPVDMDMVPAQHNGEPSILIFVREQNNSKELENKLRVLKNQDLLTGLFNRQYFLEKLQALLDRNRQERGQHALLYIDMDNFKELKGRLGVAGSDLVLVEVAEQIRTLLEVTTFPSRYDGNVFTALLPNCDEAKAMRTANRLCHTIEGHIAEVEGRSVTTTCSIGISLINDTAPSTKEVLNRGYKACAMASSSGGNQAHLYIPMDDELADQERLSNWGKRIKRAIEQDQLHLVYQPIVSLHGQGGEKYEALLRMQDEDGNELNPGQFIPAAEKSGFMPELDRWVMRQALGDLILQRNSGKDTTMFVKLSLCSIEDESLMPWLQELLNETSVGAEHIVFEISEEMTLNNMKAIKHFINGLQHLGCRLALDHFGRTANSAVVQKHLQASFLKIDGKLINSMLSDNKALERVKSIVAIAAATDSQTVAQFVEDANSLALLWQTGVNYIQGYFVQEPSGLMGYDFSELA